MPRTKGALNLDGINKTGQPRTRCYRCRKMKYKSDMRKVKGQRGYMPVEKFLCDDCDIKQIKMF